MALAYGGLAPAEMGRVVAEVQKLGIEVEYDLQGNVRVPSDKVAEIQAILARNGAAPVSGHLGTRDLSNISMTTPKSVEEAQLVAVRQGEIAKTIESIAGVDAATVLLTPGRRGSFADEDEPATASVQLTLNPGSDFGPVQAKAVATLVARSVPGLTTKYVTVIGQDGMPLYDGADEEGFAGRFATKGEAQANESKRVKRELQPMLDRAFGAGNTLLTCRVEMDFDETNVKEDKVIPHENPITEESATETMGPGGSAPAGGVSGLGSNTTPMTPDSSGGSGSYKGSKDAKQFPWDTVSTQRTKAPGTVTSMAITVLADTKTVKNVQAVENLLKGYLGPKFAQSDPNFAVTVTPTEFDRQSDKVAKDAASAAAGEERMQQIFSLLPIAALILVGFFVIKALGKVAKSSNVLVALPSAGGAGGGTYAEAPMLSSSGTGSHSTPAHNEATLRALAAARPQEPIEVGQIQERLDVPLEQIKKLVIERPNTVAMLLKSWMLEETR
jgi:flagellar M-ring protein FliF